MLTWVGCGRSVVLIRPGGYHAAPRAQRDPRADQCRPVNVSEGIPMKIILANPRGFCAGVNMAIECVDQVLKHQGAPVYVYHEIVHNKHVVDDFESRGVTFVNSIEEVPEGATVVYSAHGVSPGIRNTSKDR